MINTALSLYGLLALINAVVFILAKKYPLKIYKYVPPVIIVFLIIACCATFGVWDPSDQVIIDARANFISSIIPFMIFCMGLQTDIRKMLKIGPKMLANFVVTCITIAFAMVVGCAIFGPYLGIDQLPEAFGAWSGSYIGGVESLYAVGDALELTDEGMANVLLLINTTFRPYMTLLIVAVMPVAAAYDRWVKADLKLVEDIAARYENDNLQGGTGMPTVNDLMLIAGLGFCLVGFSKMVSPSLESVVPAVPAEVWTYVIITVVSITLGSVTKLGDLNGLGLIGSALATFALAVNVTNMDLRAFLNAGTYFACSGSVLAIHAILMLIYGKLSKTDIRSMGIASMATVGGVSSAPVVASVYGKQYQALSVIFSAMGAAIGTISGLGIARLLIALGF